TARRHLVRLAQHLDEQGRPAALARANAARAAARTGDLEGSDDLFEQAEADLIALKNLPDVNDAAIERMAVLLDARRAEGRWVTGRHDAAIDAAQKAWDRGHHLGDERMNVRLIALIAHARHDRVRQILTESPDRAADLLPDVEE